MSVLLCEIDSEKGKQSSRVEKIFLAILIPVVLMAGGLYFYKNYTGNIQTWGAMVFVISFIGLFLTLLWWGLNKWVKEDSKEAQAEDDET
jgi:hypothetical protein